MAIELSLDGLKDMKKADYFKGFKNKAIWKKAKAVIILVDYKLEGKKAVVAIPFKKETDMKAEMKRLKKEKLHLLKKSGGGTILFNKTATGDVTAQIEIQIGGLAPEVLLMKGQPLFQKIKVTLEALQSAEAAADAAESAGEIDPNENLPEDDLSDVEDATDEDEEDDDAAGEATNTGSLTDDQVKRKEEMISAMAKMEAKIEEIKGQLKI